MTATNCQNNCTSYFHSAFHFSFLRRVCAKWINLFSCVCAFSIQFIFLHQCYIFLNEFFMQEIILILFFFNTCYFRWLVKSNILFIHLIPPCLSLYDVIRSCSEEGKHHCILKEGCVNKNVAFWAWTRNFRLCLLVLLVLLLSGLFIQSFMEMDRRQMEGFYNSALQFHWCEI